MHNRVIRSKKDEERLCRLGDKIRELRIRKKETRRGLASRVALHVSSISRIENGRTEPSVLTLERIASALNVSTAVFTER